MNGASQRCFIGVSNACYQMVSSKKHTTKTIDSWNKSRERGIKKYQENRIKRLKEKKSVTSVKKVSASRSVPNAIYSILCKELKPQHTTCECCHQHPAAEIHHMKGRRGLLLIMSFYFKYICRSCHRKASDNSDWAKEIGLSVLINSRVEYVFTAREIELLESKQVKLPAKYQIKG